jgi:hypothetical protein
MHFSGPRHTITALAIFCMAGLASRSALADPGGVDVTVGANNGIVVTATAQAVNMNFGYWPTCSQSSNPSYNGKPCVVVNASQGMVGVPVTGPGCDVQIGNANTPSTVTCQAEGLSSVDIVLKNGGTIAIQPVASHPGTACSPAPVTIKTGSGANVLALNDGCHETIDCSLTGSNGVAGGDVDATDTIRGTCSSIIRH